MATGALAVAGAPPPKLNHGWLVFDLLYPLNASGAMPVNGVWLSFAPEFLLPPPLLGRPPRDFIGDLETQHIYRELHSRVWTADEGLRRLAAFLGWLGLPA